MARASASTSSITFDTSMKVEVSRLKMKRSPALDYIDVARLSKANKAEFEVGHVLVKGSKKAVFAVVKKGMVVGLKMAECEGCSGAEPTKEMLALAKRAVAALEKGKPQTHEPVPVEVFVSQQEPIGRSHCFMFCLPFVDICIICCTCCSAAESGFPCVTIGLQRAP